MAAKQWVQIGVAAALVLTVSTAGKAQVRLSAAQGSTRSMSSESAMLTLTNGVPGAISVTTQRPFVVGLVPVVGDYGGAFAPVYGPATLMPHYRPGPSVIQERIARLRQQGTPLVANRHRAGRNATARGVVDRKADDFSARFAAARQSSAGHAVESVAAIRRRQVEAEVRSVKPSSLTELKSGAR